MARLTSHLPLIVAIMLVLSSGSSRPADPVHGRSGLTPEQREFVAWGEARFTAAGLVLGEIHYEFGDGTDDCDFHHGLYHPGSGTVQICTMKPDTLLHELAHAWLESTLTQTDKTAFLESRGLEVWADHSVPWRKRGCEQAAEILAWGLAEDDQLVSWVAPDGRRITRLLSIPDSNPAELTTAYRVLTGSDPVLRDPAEWAHGDAQPDPPTAVSVSHHGPLLAWIRSGRAYHEPLPARLGLASESPTMMSSSSNPELGAAGRTGQGLVTMQELLKENPELKVPPPASENDSTSEK